MFDARSERHIAANANLELLKDVGIRRAAGARYSLLATVHMLAERKAVELASHCTLQEIVDRRSFIHALAGGVLTSPEMVWGQQAKVYRIGMLEAVSATLNAANLDAFRKGLRDAGYVEGRNLIIDYRSAEGHAERFRDLALEMVRLKVDVIVSRGTPATRAAKNATSNIPVVMATMGDPRSLVASFARPGGNVTGVTTFTCTSHDLI